jgi:hypothetical protein
VRPSGQIVSNLDLFNFFILFFFYAYKCFQELQQIYIAIATDVNDSFSFMEFKK